MKQTIKTLLIILVFLSGITQGLTAQISFGGIPPSFDYESNQFERLEAINIPLLAGLDEIKRTAEEDELWGYAPLVATAITINIDLAKDGQWTALTDGTQICRLQLHAEGASSLLLSYKTFNLPEGSSLYIYTIRREIT